MPARDRILTAMPGFTVDGDSLAAVENVLGGLAQQLGSISVDTTQYGDIMGGGHLPDVMDAFNHEWTHGISVVAHEIDQLSAHLRQAVHHYEKVDGQVQQRSKGHIGGGARPVHKVITSPGGGSHRHHTGTSTTSIGGGPGSTGIGVTHVGTGSGGTGIGVTRIDRDGEEDGTGAGTKLRRTPTGEPGLTPVAA